MLPAARIRYRDDQPYSLDHGDIYHARDGAAEVSRVFVAPCRLDQLARDRGTQAGPRAVVRVGELGFGSGLNFVIAGERCLAAGARLHFVSCEARPIGGADFAAIAAQRAAHHPLYDALGALYPPRIRGWHHRALAGGRIRLSLWLGDARAAMADLAGRQRQPLDAWFLDGFAPDRNPELWDPRLFQDLAALSAPGTRVATFTAAGRVRRALEAAGFAMSRVDQRPHKRESLAGTFAGRGLTGFAPPARVTVVGGGLAGASTAWHLARAGCRVTLADAGDEPDGDAAGPGSAMTASVLHARLLDDGTATAALRCHAFLYAAALLPGIPGFRATGVLQLADGSRPRERLEAAFTRYAASGAWLRWLDPREAAALAGWPVTAGGLHLPTGGIVDIPALVAGLAHANVEVVHARVADLPQAEPVVLACGAATGTFAPARYLEIAPVQGQLDFVAVASPPRLPLVGSGYLVPSADGLLAAGSTYEHRPWDPDTATRANLRQLEGVRHAWRYRCRGTRSVSSDRSAIAGPLFDPSGQPLPGLYVSTGHGSAGNVSAHLAGAVVAAQILGDCPPLERGVEAALSPRRFRERQARRGYRHTASPQPARGAHGWDLL